MHVQGKCMASDFVLYHLVGIDVILGMDWLEKNQAIIDCEKNEIHLTLEGDIEGKRIFFQNKEQLGRHPGLISYMQAVKYLRQGCQGYLASMVGGTEGEKADVNPTSVRVVGEYLDIFPDELSGLLPMRDSEFVIDVLPGTTPMSKAPYKMTPVELQELKIQLKEMLDKGFIRPSVSPWGALVLFVKKKDGSMRLCLDYRLCEKEGWINEVMYGL